MGCDFCALGGKIKLCKFQSTHPVWGATRTTSSSPPIRCNFNPRTPYGVRPDSSQLHAGAGAFQSTHPVWGATSPPPFCVGVMNISIHAPRMGCDHIGRRAVYRYLIFQSTHPVWGATCRAWRTRYGCCISIHAPRMGCDSEYDFCARDIAISIHAPRMGCDRGERIAAAGHRPISIHAPRMGCDVGLINDMTASISFQSTHPVWGATTLLVWARRRGLISIHAPRMGCDKWGVSLQWDILIFQSTHPVWGATSSP